MRRSFYLYSWPLAHGLEASPEGIPKFTLKSYPHRVSKKGSDRRVAQVADETAADRKFLGG